MVRACSGAHREHALVDVEDRVVCPSVAVHHRVRVDADQQIVAQLTGGLEEGDLAGDRAESEGGGRRVIEGGGQMGGAVEGVSGGRYVRRVEHIPAAVDVHDTRAGGRLPPPRELVEHLPRSGEITGSSKRGRVEMEARSRRDRREVEASSGRDEGRLHPACVVVMNCESRTNGARRSVTADGGEIGRAR